MFLIAVVTAAGVRCGGSPTSPSGNAKAQVHVVVIRANNGSFSFDPVNEIVQVGQSVAWRNEDSMTHALVDKNGQGLLSTGNIAPGATSAVVSYRTSMTIEYHCSIHPSMKGLLSINP